MFKSILVLESPWDSESLESTSVWPMVREFAEGRGIKAFHRPFLDRASFKHWVEVYDALDLPGPKLLYVAGHGVNGRISGLHNEINRDTIITILEGAESISHAHFGTCLFGSGENLDEVLLRAPHLRWVAGYTECVDWVDSTLLDLMLWGRIESRDDETKGQRTHTLADKLVGQVNGLATKLGFRMHFRYGDSILSVTPNPEP